MHPANINFGRITAFGVEGPFLLRQSQECICESRHPCPVMLHVHAAKYPAAFARFCDSVLKQTDLLPTRTPNLRRTHDLLWGRWSSS